MQKQADTRAAGPEIQNLTPDDLHKSELEAIIKLDVLYVRPVKQRRISGASTRRLLPLALAQVRDLG